MIYLHDVHPKLLTKTYAQDRCAQCFAYSAVWLMQLGKIREAIERCELVMMDLVPKYDKKDVLGILNVFIPIIRVLKWHVGIILSIELEQCSNNTCLKLLNIAYIQCASQCYCYSVFAAMTIQLLALTIRIIWRVTSLWC